MSGAASKIAPLGSIKNPVKYAGQDYEKLRAECLASKKLFQDPKFPVTDKDGNVWKRPKDIQKDPQFVVGGMDTVDSCQGGLNDCWFVSAMASLTMNKDCLNRVVPQGQSFDQKTYAGIFHFVFWQYGQWVDVVVDDMVATKNNKPTYARSGTANEFWTILLQKAYAKVCGSYAAMNYGYPMEALVNFTGGVSELYQSEKIKPDFFQKIQTTLKDKNFIGCYTSADEHTNGIHAQHAYAVLGAEEVTLKTGEKVQLIKVRNPLYNLEFTGAWSDKSKEWENVDDKVREKLNVQKEDGEYWIAYPEFLKEFYRVEICNISLSEACCGDNYKWLLTDFIGSWKEGSTAGGDHNQDTFWMNPQFRITLAAADGDPSKKRPIVVSLAQKNRRQTDLKGSKYPFLAIGFYIYKVKPENKIPLDKKFFADNKWAGRIDFYAAYQELSQRFELPPGDYVIVAAASKPSNEGDFYLRVFTEKPVKKA